MHRKSWKHAGMYKYMLGHCLVWCVCVPVGCVGVRACTCVHVCVCKRACLCVIQCIAIMTIKEEFLLLYIVNGKMADDPTFLMLKTSCTNTLTYVSSCSVILKIEWGGPLDKCYHISF